MSENILHDQLAVAVDRRTSELEARSDFAERHEAPVVRSIRRRRVTVRASVAAAALLVGVTAVLGVTTVFGERGTVSPVGTPTPTSTAPALTLDLIPLSIDAPGMYMFYVTFGAPDTIPLSAFGIPYPGPDVPSDAVLLAVCGDTTGGYDAYAADTNSSCDPGVFDGRTGELQPVSSDAFDIVGHVSSYTRWGVHFFLVDGSLVTEAEARARPDAVEVTAMVGSDIPAVVPAATIETDIVPLPTDFPEWYYFYVTFGATDRIPAVMGGVDPGDLPDVPSDAILLFVHGGSDGYDLSAPGAMSGNFGGMDADGSMGDTVVPKFEVIGDVTSTTRWGVHFYLVDDHLVTVVDGRANPYAVEVTAMISTPGSS